MDAESLVKSRFPDAAIRWNDMKVQVRTGKGMLLGSVRLEFLKPYLDLESAAWDDAAANLNTVAIPTEAPTETRE